MDQEWAKKQRNFYVFNLKMKRRKKNKEKHKDIGAKSESSVATTAIYHSECAQ